MQYTFSDRISALKPSAIREILKATQDPNAISFAAGSPASEAFPAAQMQIFIDEILTKNPAAALTYGVSEGYTPLREAAKARMRDKYQTGTDDDDILIVTGGQQGIELLSKCVLNEGDTVISEAPSFIGALNAFRSFGVDLVGVPMEHDGMNIASLEKALAENPKAKFIYVIPTFQNPSGYVTSLEKRKAILELAKKYDVLILEDNPYFELRYSGSFVPTIKSLDTEGRVVYCGSFSKILSPGIRVGYVIAGKEMIAKMTVAKQVSDVHTNLVFQMVAQKMLTEFDIDRHIAWLCDLYREKRDAMTGAIRRYLPSLSFVEPEGGLFLWLKLPDSVSGADFAKACAAKGVMCVPGATFLTDEAAACPYVRLNFSTPSLAQIEEGVRRMGEVAKEFGL
ncbi:MAG: PLP-dependent aminotransferase family protein [Oscillospiraceae bacterium]|nr:PLP-dependent aminotransferase family protein [Oscillospiraceae bacterium]